MGFDTIEINLVELFQKTSFTKYFPFLPRSLVAVIFPIFKPLIKKNLLQNISRFYQGVQTQFYKWNYPNRRWNYFACFHISIQKNFLFIISSILPRSPKLVSETGIEIEDDL